MRFLMRIVIPTPAENSIGDDPQLEERLRLLYVSVGGLKAYSRNEDGRRVDYILVDFSDLSEITTRAKRIFETLKVKTEFYPQKSGDELFGL